MLKNDELGYTVCQKGCGEMYFGRASVDSTMQFLRRLNLELAVYSPCLVCNEAIKEIHTFQAYPSTIHNSHNLEPPQC